MNTTSAIAEILGLQPHRENMAEIGFNDYLKEVINKLEIALAECQDLYQDDHSPEILKYNALQEIINNLIK